MRHIPNILSAIRLLLVGVFVGLFLSDRVLAALSIFIFAFFTDVLDGRLARQYGWVSNLGKLLDPLADKLMTVAALVCVWLGHRKPVYLALFILMAVKELLMLLGGLFMARRQVVAFAAWPGKIATGLFAVGVVLSLVSLLTVEVEPWNILILALATLISWASLFYYAARQLPRALGREKKPLH